MCIYIYICVCVCDGANESDGRKNFVVCVCMCVYVCMCDGANESDGRKHFVVSGQKANSLVGRLLSQTCILKLRMVQRVVGSGTMVQSSHLFKHVTRFYGYSHGYFEVTEMIQNRKSDWC